MDRFIKDRSDRRSGKRIARQQDLFDRNSDDAWEQIKATFSKPTAWILTALALIGIVFLAVVLNFVFSIRAPMLPNTQLPGLDLEEGLERPGAQAGRKEGVYTFLLVGTDAGSSNTDTIMVVNYDVNEGQASMLSIPRDTMVNARWDIKRINSVYSVHGISGLQEYIGKLIGFTPDYYVKINVHAFTDVIELLGGVDFDVPRDMDYDDPAQNLHIHLKKGYQHLDGLQSMGLVRWRHNNNYTLGYSDEERMKTQQRFLKAAVEQCVSLKNWNKIDDLVKMFYENVESDLTLGEMLWFAKQALSVDFGDIQTFTLPGNYNAKAWSRTYHCYQSYVTVDAEQMLEIVNEHFNPYQSEIRYQDLDIMTIRADGSVSSSTGYTADTKAATAPSIPAPPTGTVQEPEEGTGNEPPTGGEADELPNEPPTGGEADELPNEPPTGGGADELPNEPPTGGGADELPNEPPTGGEV